MPRRAPTPATGWRTVLAVAVLAPAILALSGCGAAPDDVVRASAELTAQPRALDAAHPALGPTAAEIGRAYPYDLYVHCGGEYASFSSASWRTTTPPGDVAPPATGSVVSYSGYLAGWMTQVEADVAVFTIASSTRQIVYHRVDDSAPPCA